MRTVVGVFVESLAVLKEPDGQVAELVCGYRTPLISEPGAVRVFLQASLKADLGSVPVLAEEEVVVEASDPRQPVVRNDGPGSLATTGTGIGPHPG